MDDFKRMAIFATVVEQGSMSAAARSLGMSPSAVSQQIRQLEAQGGVTLLTRSTRQLALTDAGQRFYEQCAAMARAAEQARAELSSARDEPSGELRLACTVGFARHVAPALGPWLAQHPQLRLHLAVDDAPIDLIQHRIDLAVRFGRLPDSNWAAKRLGAMQWWLCAAPQWLKEQETQGCSPELHPTRLTQQRWLGMSRDSAYSGDKWLVRVRCLNAQNQQPAETVELSLAPQIVSNNQLSLQQMCEDGLGLALLASMDVAPAVAGGQLQRLLAQWDFGQLDIWVVTPQRQAQPAKVRQAVAALQIYLARLEGVFDTALPAAQSLKA